MCANIEPGAKCPLNGDMLCQNERPVPAGQPGAGTTACSATRTATHTLQPVTWEPARPASPSPMPS